jgi:hypothetical protein
MKPQYARLEDNLNNNVSIYNVSHLLLKTKPIKRQEKVRVLFFHHSGADGAEGFKAVENTVNYFVKERKINSKPYCFYLNYVPDVDENNNLVIYKLESEDNLTSSTGGCNNFSLGIVFQGDLTNKGPSKQQIIMADELIKHLKNKYKDVELSYHSEADKYGGHSKPTCPGKAVEKYVKGKRTK